MLQNATTTACLLCSLLLLTPPASPDVPASQPATSQPADQQTSPPFTEQILQLEELFAEVGFEGHYDQRDVRQDTGQFLRPRYRQKDRAYGLEETVGLGAQGTLFDERVLEFDVSGVAGLTQEWFVESRPGPDRRRSPDGDLLEYDTSLTLFPQGMFSANAYAVRQDSRIPRAFLPSLDRTEERYGVDLTLNHHTFPMRFSYEHVFDELSSRTRRLRDDEERGHERFRYEGTWQISDQHALNLEYEYEDRGERYSGTRKRFDTRRHYLTLDHTLRFGRDDRSSWETLARFQDESGELARDFTEVWSNLRLQHTDSLSSHFRGQYLRDAFEELTTESWRGEVGLTHELSDVLTSSLDGYVLRENADTDADFGEWGGLANVAFHKDNTLGRLSANLSFHHMETETHDGGRGGIVIAEAVTLRDPLPSFLTRTDVNRFTIVVTDADRTRTYLPIRDYWVVRVGRYTALKRVPNGRIADRETVLVSYTYRVADDYDVRRDRFDVRVQQDFKFGLTPYYAASIQDEDADGDRFRLLRARDVERHRVGATFRQERWSVGVEYEYNDDTVDPYDALHANGDIVLWRSACHELDATAAYSMFWFDGTRWLRSHDTKLFDAGLSYRYLLGEQLEATTAALYRYEDDSLFGITHGVDLTGAVEWRIGYFTLSFEAEYDALDLPGSSDDGFSVWLKLRRRFPLIARSEP